MCVKFPIFILRSIPESTHNYIVNDINNCTEKRGHTTITRKKNQEMVGIVQANHLAILCIGEWTKYTQIMKKKHKHKLPIDVHLKTATVVRHIILLSIRLVLFLLGWELCPFSRFYRRLSYWATIMCVYCVSYTPHVSVCVELQLFEEKQRHDPLLPFQAPV